VYDARVHRALVLLILLGGCGASRYRGPGLLAGVGALMAGGGSIAFAVGDRPNSESSTAQQVGVVSLVIGLGAIFAGGIWAAQVSRCDADADCGETEFCQKQFTTAGPYGHCVGR
jgi:hypothetical protein